MPIFDINIGSLRAAGEKVTGKIHVIVCEKAFPESDWDDFPLTVLTWWYQALIAAQLGCGTSVICSFMDGPFSFEFHNTQLPRWRLLTKKGDTTLSSLEVPRDEVWSAFHRARRHMQSDALREYLVRQPELRALLDEFSELYTGNT